MRSLVALIVLLIPMPALFAQGDSIPPFEWILDQSLDQCFRNAMLEYPLEMWMPVYVQREIALSQDQKEHLEAEIKSIGKQHLDRYVNSVATNSDPAAKEAMRRESHANHTAAVRSAIETALEPHQLSRLRQILNQVNLHDLYFSRGSDVLEKVLNLTDDQKAKLAQVAPKIREQMKRESEFLMIKLMRTELNEVLTDKQRERANELLGEPLAAGTGN